LLTILFSVLYQRGIYPPEDFKVVKKYGLNVLVTTDDEVKSYIKRIMGQLSRSSPLWRPIIIGLTGWMKDGKISKLVMAIVSKDTGEVLERWQFDIQVFGQSLQTYQASRGTEQEKENQK
jgi:mitotic spindle assembly checkpoint protein MAD2